MRIAMSILFGWVVVVTPGLEAQVLVPIDECSPTAVPVVDIGPYHGNTCPPFTSTQSSYGGSCTVQGVPYPGNDVIYEIVLYEGAGHSLLECRESLKGKLRAWLLSHLGPEALAGQT